MRTTARVFAVATMVMALLDMSATTVAAQDENALKAYFEGRRVTLRMDMPGTSDGVDLQVDPPRSIDYKKYRENLKRYGVAIGSGDSSTVTLIKLKKDLIEFQIGGGGYGTFGDDTSTSSNVKLLDKTEREKTLEKRIKEETDRDRKRALQRELDELRDRRERENRILQAESDRIEEAKRERIAEKRLQGGSRFNLHWSPRVPPTLKPEDVEKALVEYVDFRGGSYEERRTPVVDLSAVRKGMFRDEVEAAFGKPAERSDKREGALTVTTLVFEVGDERLTASFVEDVLVRYTISSK
jgi:hypothetical protein